MNLELYKGSTDLLVLSHSMYYKLYLKLGYFFTSKLSHSGSYSMTHWFLFDKKIEVSYMCNDNQGFVFNKYGTVYEIEFNLDKETFHAFKSV